MNVRKRALSNALFSAIIDFPFELSCFLLELSVALKTDQLTPVDGRSVMDVASLAYIGFSHWLFSLYRFVFCDNCCILDHICLFL